MGIYLAGSEGILGTVSAIAAICSIVALYIYGRSAKQKDLTVTLVGSGLLFLASAAVLAFSARDFGIIFYAIFMEIALAFSSVATSTLFCSLTEEEMGMETDARYSYIFDNELFLNLGRLLGVGIVICFALFGSEHAGLFYGLMCVASVHVLFLSIYFYLRKRSKREKFTMS